ncbi:MAG: type II toxin-antitoxin system VapC family toxin [Alphaproteobacteria bacterium]|nr:type II toxin-antitoxin system VapC family toxin [Alphaproteobacteria bacterium]MBV8410528.1 type II toxin-antitoxin system VapC family toxin [Alphaproteobacteria bacterium]
MRLLLDTHAFLWWLAGDSRLTKLARSQIEAAGSDTFISAASAWEIATKYRLGKLPQAALVALDVASGIESQEFTPLPVSVLHGQAAGALPGPHRDPFDRMLVAQAMLEELVLVSNERLFDAYGVNRLW